ncbi:MAG: PEP-CTERM sorting domain-containing protein [Planctomycetales bacterium]|nr:PEP-CTERM sorting domain-containing protein [Planctomycetales bacterium]MCA9171730.1 PEP-CTERM sorting domain-containing protein [Planctomycetales bacterium]
MNQKYFFATLCALLICSANFVSAGTIIKLGFSADSRDDFEFTDGVLSTFDDEFAATLGEQNTEVTFLGVLDTLTPIERDRASFTLNGVTAVGSPTVIGVTLLQPTAGGEFKLYGPSNDLLLAGTLGEGTLSGPIGGPATGGFLTTRFGVFTGGSLMTTLDGADLSQASFSISLIDVNQGDGLSLGTQGELLPFTADATAIIGGQVQTPEPGSLVLLGLGLLGLCGLRRR